MTSLGVVGRSRLDATVESILSVQAADGLIPWFEGGRADPWNHVEAAMALCVAGEHDGARLAFGWLASNQRSDGSWHAAYTEAGGVLERHVDTNAVAYVASGVLHYLVSTSDSTFSHEMLRVVTRALDFVCAHQSGDGMIPWSIGEDGTPSTDSLLAASASVAMSLRCGSELASALGAPREDWLLASDRLAWCLRSHESDFADKSFFAMDWYYPVLSGTLDQRAARHRLAARRSDFVVSGEGVRCRSDGRWVTAAETAECAIAYARSGSVATGRRLLSWAESLRDADGSYLTGVVLPERSAFPPGERSTYSAAAVVLADDVCSGGPSAAIFSALC